MVSITLESLKVVSTGNKNHNFGNNCYFCNL